MQLKLQPSVTLEAKLRVWYNTQYHFRFVLHLYGGRATSLRALLTHSSLRCRQKSNKGGSQHQSCC